MRERDIEDYLKQRVKAMGGETRKVKWIGRNSAPDRLVMLPTGKSYSLTLTTPISMLLRRHNTIWVELKRPGKLATFPADEHERAQHREHERMRALGQRVVVIDSLAGVDELLS